MAIIHGNWDYAYEHQEDYASWIRKGGFPAQTSDCLPVLELDTETETYVADGTRRKV